MTATSCASAAPISFSEKLRNSAGTFLLLLLLILGGSPALAQDFTIEQVNASMFPTVSLRIRSADGKPIQKTDIHLTDGSQPVTDFTFSPAKTALQPVVDSNAVSGPRAICFLVETSAFTSREQVEAVKRVLTRQLRTLGNGAVVAVCYYSGEGGLAKVGPEFTEDYTTLIRDLNSRLQWSGGAPHVDFYKALYDCLDFIQNRRGLPDSRQLIVISTGNHNLESSTNLAAVEQKNALSGIVINTTGLRSATANAIDNLKVVSERMDGEYRKGVSEDDIEAAVATFLGGQLTKKPGKASSSASALAGVYELKYNSPVKDAAQGRIALTVGGVTRLEQYGIPGKAEAYTRSGRLNIPKTVGLIAGILLALGLVIYFVSKRRKRALNENELRPPLPPRQEASPPGLPQPGLQEEKPLSPPPAAEPLIAPQTPAEALPVIEQPAPPGQHRTVIAGMKLPYFTILLKGSQRSFPMTQQAISIGRAADNSVVISEPTVSAHHATISFEDDQWFITDKGSTNGTYVNGQRTDRALLQPGAQIAVGAVGCLFEMK